MKSNTITQMSFDLFETCLAKIPLRVDIHFTGMCEPWLNPECTRMLLYAHERGHRIGVSTTLVGMAFSDIDLMESVPFKFFRVHLPSAEENENIIKGKTYIQLLKRVIKTNINKTFHFHGKNLHPEISHLIRNVQLLPLCSRGQNITLKHRPSPPRHRGTLGCVRKLRNNVLLPNGDVLLCSMDYGMQHVLGNLMAADYASLFSGQEFSRIKRGQSDEGVDLLCRYCDLFVTKENETDSGLPPVSQSIQTTEF
jgi:hypothetical protein